MRIFQATIPFDDPDILLETLGQILDIHQRLEAATESIMEIEENHRTQKRALDVEQPRHPIKRQRHYGPQYKPSERCYSRASGNPPIKN